MPTSTGPLDRNTISDRSGLVWFDWQLVQNGFTFSDRWCGYRRTETHRGPAQSNGRVSVTGWCGPGVTV